MQKLYRKVIVLLSFLFIIFTTVAYSALSTSLTITSNVMIRPISDIRVDNIELYGSTQGDATIQYQSEYNVDSITSGFILPKSNSAITYKVTIANNGDFDQTIYNITSSSNLPVDYVIKYSDGSNFNYKDIIPKKSSVDLYITYTTTSPSNSVINAINVFEFRKVYKIVYEELGGTSVNDQYKYEGENLVLNLVNNVLEEPRKTGYVFQGWTDVQNGTTVKYTKGYTLTIDLDDNPIYTLYALYTKDIYTITFDPDNGEESIVKKIEYNLAYGELPEVSKTGYTLEGWYNSNDEEVTSATLATKNDTITAHWTPNTYTITLDKNGGTNNSTASITATYDSSDLEPARLILPERIYTVSGFGLSNSRKSNGATVSGTDDLTVSYTFSGWYTQRSNGILLMDSSETPTLISDVNEYTDEESNWVHDDDITLFAHYTGTGSVTLPTIDKTGYTCGWTTNELATTIQYQSGETLTNVIADIPLYGVCVANTYTVTADSNGGTIPSTSGWSGTGNTSTKTVTYDSEYGNLPTPTRTGYTFSGWNGKNLLDLSRSWVSQGTLNNDNSVTSNLNNEYYSSIVFTYLNDYFMNNLGQTFTFSMNESVSDKFIGIVIYGDRTTTVNRYQENNVVNDRKVSITVSDDFTSISSIELSFNRSLSPFTDTTTTRTNFQLEEGSTATPYEPYYVTSSIPVTQAKNHTLTAIWSTNTYAVILDNQSATTAGTTGIYEKYDTGYYLDITQLQQMSTSSNGITIPTKTGYTFGGYYTQTNGNGVQYIDSSGKLTSSASTTNFTDNTGKLYAKWTYTNSDPETAIRALNTEGTTIATTDHENELRFIGSNPNNYVRFNNQTWRIIGVFDGRLKLIQNPIGNYSYDTSSSTVNRGYGVNQWGESTLTDGSDYDGADLMKLLNPGYEENEDLRCIAGSTLTNGIVNCGDNSASNYDTIEVNNSLYWNAGSGKCYTYGNYNTTDCDFTDTGLKDTTSKNMIDNAEWFLGSLDTPSANIWDGRITASLLYNWERSNNSGKQCTQNNAHCSDTVNRTTRWTGKVGLLYPSDYAYATSGGTTYDRDACLSYTVGYVSSSSIPNWENTYTDCKDNDWLLNTSMWTWTLSPRGHSSYSYTVFYVNSTGYVLNSDALRAGSVRPVVYLKSSVTFTGGDGTQSNPFIFSDTTPSTYAVILDSGSSTTRGTTGIYEKYDTAYYLDVTQLKQMTTSSNGITIPTKTGYVFGGYYTGKNGTGTQYIDANGKLTSSASTTNFTDNTGKLYAKWTRVMAENIGHTNSTLGCSDAQCMMDELYDLLN